MSGHGLNSALNCPFHLPVVGAYVLSLAAPPRELHFPLAFPCSTTPGRWMFSSFHIFAGTRVVTGVPPHLHLSAGGGVVARTLSPLAKGGAGGESWAAPQAGPGGAVQGDGNALLLTTPPSWTPCIISPRHKHSSWQRDRPQQFNPAAELALALILLP